LTWKVKKTSIHVKIDKKEVDKGYLNITKFTLNKLILENRLSNFYKTLINKSGYLNRFISNKKYFN
jgi:hypothetical protein